MSLRAATTRPRKRKGAARVRKPAARASLVTPGLALFLLAGVILTAGGWWFQDHYTLSFQSPVRLRFQWPVVISQRIRSEGAEEAQADQRGRRLTAWQQYACRVFGPDCRLALAIQRAENPQGKCEIYHYNPDGTLDWGYFQINTVHLQRPGLNLRDLLDCKANIDFAYQLYREKGGFTPWSTFNNGRYRQFMGQ